MRTKKETAKWIVELKAAYPKLIELMAQFRKGPSQDILALIRTPRLYKQFLAQYRKFLRFKDSTGGHGFYTKYMGDQWHTETIKSPTFGKKTFYKTNIPIIYWDLFITVEPL